MARIKLSPLVTDIRASVADITFSKWKGTNYIRSKVIPTYTNTPDQQVYRRAVKIAVILWQIMPWYIQAVWNNWASGSGISGFNKFLSSNIKDMVDGLTIGYCYNELFPEMDSFTSEQGGPTPGEIKVLFAPTPVPTAKTLNVIWYSKDLYECCSGVTSFAAGQTSPKIFNYVTLSRYYSHIGWMVDAPVGETPVCTNAKVTPFITPSPT